MALSLDSRDALDEEAVDGSSTENSQSRPHHRASLITTSLIVRLSTLSFHFRLFLRQGLPLWTCVALFLVWDMIFLRFFPLMD